MLFGEKILNYWDDILADLAKLVAVPSVAQPEPGAHPFGDACAQALDTVLEMAKGYGLETKNVDYYAGHAEYGHGEENAVVMAHVDVVPAGEGWSTDPYALTIRNGWAFGRGVADDKGAAIVALHCLRALKDAQVPAKRKLRVIFGCGEEIGMADIPHYFTQEQLPDMGFTPDSSYGICHCEKGIINLRVEGANDSSLIKHFSAGTVSNAVPAKALCEIVCSREELTALQKAAEDSEISYTITPTGEGASILASGKAAHAAFPEGGRNAAAYLVKLLSETFGAQRLGSFFSFVSEKIGLATDGSTIGVQCADEPSGPLTFNLGLLHADESTCSLTVDIRYPATCHGSDISKIIQSAAEGSGLSYSLLSDLEPLYLPRESKLIALLSGAYQDVTGEPCSIFSMGGGTYARQMHGRGVAFGPGFPGGKATHEHDADERIDLEKFKVHAQICLEAMYRMLTAESE